MKDADIHLIKRSTSYKIVIPTEVEEQIRFLCSKVWDVEWSGILFYTHEGSFEDGSLIIKCKDILPMDIGSQGYTEFLMSPDVIHYMAENPELLECGTGLIHSHNNMATFFSGTDTDTLKEEGNERNHFVSLIVNNAGKYTAAITRKITYNPTYKIKYNSFTGDEVEEIETFEETTDIEWFNLDIVKEGNYGSKLKDLEDRLQEIKTKKQEAKATLSEDYSASPYTFYSGSPVPLKDTSKYCGSLFDDYEDYKEPIKDKELLLENKEPSNLDPKLLDKVVPEIIQQLLTGCVTLKNSSKFDIDYWCKKMEGLFDVRFSKDLFKFESWAVSFIEYLCWFDYDSTNDGSATIAHAVAEELEKLPSNKYINKYIEILNGYE